MRSEHGIFAPTSLNHTRMFLILFCSTLAAQLLVNFRDQLRFLQTAPTRVYGQPVRLLGLCPVPTLNTRQFCGTGLLFIVSLLSAAAGLASRWCLFVALCCYFLYFSQIISLAYIQRKTNLLPLVLLILLVSPSIGQPLHHSAPLWPLVLTKIVLAQMYGSAGVQKLRRGGLRWCNGRVLQAYLVHAYLWGDTPGALRLARHPRLCMLLSALVVTFELTFWLLLLYPSLTYGYVLGGLVFHSATAFTMRIHYLKYLSPVYTVFATELAFQWLPPAWLMF